MHAGKIALLGIVCSTIACAPETRSYGGNGGASASSSGTGGFGGQGGANTSSSSSGGGGMGPIGTLGQPCAIVGMLGCAGNAQKSQLICGEDLTWQTNGTCGPDLLCDTSPGVNQGTCQPIVPVCLNQNPLDVVCDKDDRVECGPDLVTSTVVESCAAGCQSGVCLAVCKAGDTQCAGNFVQTCTAIGQWGPEAPCPPDMPICNAGACTEPRSCQGLSKTCGPKGDESCCTSILVPGGTFNRINDTKYPATVSDYRLDRFEVTVGRFRKFYEAYQTAKPVAGAGAQPNIPGSGWDSTWDANLPMGPNALQSALSCGGLPSWTALPAGNENKAIGCVDWYLLFAFCAWDGGFLPTEAQWNYAAAGGSEQRAFPWGPTMPDASLATFDCNGAGNPGACVAGDLLPVGALSPKGDGTFGHADLAGGMFEFVLDKYSTPYSIANCQDCAEIVTGASRVIRGGDWKDGVGYLPNGGRNQGGPLFRMDYLAGRCARIP